MFSGICVRSGIATKVPRNVSELNSNHSYTAELDLTESVIASSAFYFSRTSITSPGRSE